MQGDRLRSSPAVDHIPASQIPASLVRQTGVVTCGPGNRLIPHQVDEYVEIGQLIDAARIYVASALGYLAP